MSSLRHRFAASRVAPAQTVEDFVGVKIDPERRRGRGAETNRSGRYEPQSRDLIDDGWGSVDDLPALKTTVQEERPRKIITTNELPDISFDRSINPYRGCEHGCSYCFARPTHAYMGLSPGLDFETKLFAKPNAAKLLEKRAGQARLRAAHHGDRHQHRPLPADREALPHHARGAGGARRRQPPGRHRHQVGAGAPRHRHPLAHGRAQPLQGRALGDHARPQARPGHGAARRDARAPARYAPSPLRGGHPDHGDGRADHPGAQRIRDRAHPRCRSRRRRARGGLRPSPPAARGPRHLQGVPRARVSRTGRSTSCR